MTGIKARSALPVLDAESFANLLSVGGWVWVCVQRWVRILNLSIINMKLLWDIPTGNGACDLVWLVELSA